MFFVFLFFVFCFFSFLTFFLSLFFLHLSKKKKKKKKKKTFSGFIFSGISPQFLKFSEEKYIFGDFPKKTGSRRDKNSELVITILSPPQQGVIVRQSWLREKEEREIKGVGLEWRRGGKGVVAEGGEEGLRRMGVGPPGMETERKAQSCFDFVWLLWLLLEEDLGCSNIDFKWSPCSFFLSFLSN